MNDINQLLALSLLSSVAAVVLAIIRWSIMKKQIEELKLAPASDDARVSFTGIIVAIGAACAAFALRKLGQ